MRVKTTQDLSNLKTWEELRRYVSQVVSSIVTVINGKIDLVDNGDTSLVPNVIFAAANTTVIVPHTLNRIPSGYLVSSRSTAITIFDGDMTNNKEFVYVQASGAGMATLLIF